MCESDDDSTPAHDIPSHARAAATVPNVPGAFGKYPLPKPLLMNAAIREYMRAQLWHVPRKNTRRMISSSPCRSGITQMHIEPTQKVNTKQGDFYEKAIFLFSPIEAFSKLVC
jgi:hypothetical protein